MLLPALALSVIGLLLGAALVTLGRRQALASAALDGFSLGFVPAVLALRMLPHAMGSLGVRALALAALAYGAIWWVDKRAHDRDHAAAHPFHPAAGAGAGLLLPMLAVHGMSDGAALAVALSSRGVGAGLALALIVHRMPEGLFIASSMLPRAGRRNTAVALGALALSNVIGAALGQALLDAIPDQLFDGALALGVGAMLRLAMHSHAPRPPTASARGLAGFTFLAGVVLVLLLPDPGGVLRRAHPRELSVQGALVPLFVETAPSMLLGVLAAGLLRALVAVRSEASLRGGGAVSQALRGLVFGLPLQLCSCGVSPIARGMLRAAVPVAAVTSFLVATPELDVGGFILSVRLLGLPLALARLGAGLALALAVSLSVASVARRIPLRVPSPSVPRKGMLAAPRTASSLPPPTPRSFAGAWRAGLASLDAVAAWYVFGLVLAAGFEAAVAPGSLARLLGAWDVPVTALLAVPVYVCAQGATPLAAMMVHKGLSPGAALALLLVGPAANLAAWRLLRGALGARVAWAFAGVSFAGAVALGLLTNRAVAPSTLPAIHALASHAHPPWELASAAVLALLLAGSLLRLGPRAWLATMGPAGVAPAHHHDHDHHDHHDHPSPTVHLEGSSP